MRLLLWTVLALLFGLGGCAGTPLIPPNRPSAPPAAPASVPAEAPAEPTPTPAEPAPPTPEAVAQAPPAAQPTVPQAAAEPAPPNPPAGKRRAPQPSAASPAPAAAPTDAKTQQAAATKAQAQAQAQTQAPAQTQAQTLDLTSLEQRLRDTRAIGVFTKLSLKNQVDDLLAQFREFYDGRSKMALPDLRQRYDLLLMKVLSLLQNADPPLATDIAASRNAIWGILADPKKFSKLQT